MALVRLIVRGGKVCVYIYGFLKQYLSSTTAQVQINNYLGTQVQKNIWSSFLCVCLLKIHLKVYVLTQTETFSILFHHLDDYRGLACVHAQEVVLLIFNSVVNI